MVGGVNMPDRRLLCIGLPCRSGYQATASRTISRHWCVTSVASIEQALSLPTLGSFRVACVWVGADDHHRSTDTSLAALEQAGIHCIALLPPGAMEHLRTRELIAGHFYDYHTLPVDSSRLLVTLGHAHGMATLRNQAAISISRDDPRSKDDLRKLIAYLQSLREAERSRIARDVHDELGQSLTALNLTLHRLRKASGTKAGCTGAEWKLAATLVNDLIQATQQIATELRPPVLDSMGLTAACEWYCGEFAQRTHIACAFAVTDFTVEPDSEQKIALFRILQEALTNVARHAEARTVEVMLERKGANIVLRITDDGRGFQAESAIDAPGLGLLGMRERATMLGGRLAITNCADGGAAVRVSIPTERHPAGNRVQVAHTQAGIAPRPEVGAVRGSATPQHETGLDHPRLVRELKRGVSSR